MPMKHVLTAHQFSKVGLAKIFSKTDAMRTALDTAAGRRKLLQAHPGKLLATLFYEPSTRTRLSFEAAAQRLGLGILSTENAGEFSSAIKGETLEDTIRILDGYADIIVLRHPETGAAEKAASASRQAVINAGDGKGEHPTQALLDLYTILQEKGRLDNLTVIIGGDLANGRTARSLAQMLALYPKNTIRFVSVPDLRVGDDIKEHLQKNNLTYDETDDMYGALQDADVVYWTRLQKERLSDPKLESSFVIDQAALKVVRKDAVIMHPLPRINEIDTLVDKDPRAAYFRQAENGMYVRMALIDTLLTS